MGTIAIKEPPPVRLDCAYLVTAWPVGGADLPLQEHRLLSQSLRRLLRFPTIPPEFLRGSLIGQQPPLPTVTARPDGLANPAEFWTALGSRLRVALTLKATIGVTAFDAVSDHLVLMKQLGVGATLGAVDETFIQIGGRVLAPALAVRAQANLASAGNGTATLAAAVDSALFRPGDIVLLTDSGNPDAHGACRHPRRERHDDPARARAAAAGLSRRFDDAPCRSGAAAGLSPPRPRRGAGAGIGSHVHAGRHDRCGDRSRGGSGPSRDLACSRGSRARSRWIRETRR